ncbi:hypothetical protein [Paractinoplanes hotanensis]|uniref:DUF2231 domain-containing protein n=1 Tax=Paractinoplanes hotanensis TaxID=2906497 RepID=A0ABT0YF49_9ACTN|nr:hypothetical protein [Actinoplanes hotanensis]MCM4084672.1 hypothetical protein [Actinoplanes hotanensis]
MSRTAGVPLRWRVPAPAAGVVAWMVVFVVATIAGERLELAHVTMHGRSAERWFLTGLAALLVGAIATTLLVRVVLGDAGLERVWRWAGTVNVVAVLAFAACAVALSWWRRTPTAPTRATATSRPAAVGARS